VASVVAIEMVSTGRSAAFHTVSLVKAPIVRAGDTD
jgi:hypothetical protein